MKTMKKIITLTTAFVMALVMTAMARQPQVTLSISNTAGKDYDVSIDGRFYTGNNITIPDLYQGLHTVQVYEVRSSGIFGIGRKRILVSSSEFRLRDYDMQIDVDRYGQLRINEYGYNDGRNNNGGWNGNDGGWNNRGDNCGDKRYDHSNGNWNNGRGNKYGHYKKHSKKGNRYYNDQDR